MRHQKVSYKGLYCGATGFDMLNSRLIDSKLIDCFLAKTA